MLLTRNSGDAPPTQMTGGISVLQFSPKRVGGTLFTPPWRQPMRRRHRLPNSPGKKVRIGISVNQAQLDHLEKLAANQGLTLSRLVMELAGINQITAK